ncbi:hypothetical protein C1H46_018496 [Malus baccata]|uniref:Uncharacterized protein n=1 Tax=Malus baccata TaxID=106549 RepID=A0A540MB01_MALBA|nr:hypothetical protein C1H46_018496 [Malus baccata]
MGAHIGARQILHTPSNHFFPSLGQTTQSDQLTQLNPTRSKAPYKSQPKIQYPFTIHVQATKIHKKNIMVTLN